MQEALKRLVAHMRWADQRVLDELKRAEEPDEPLKFYAHVLAAERLWYLRLHEENWTVIPVWPDYTLQQCETMAAENAALLEKFISGLTDTDCGRRITYTNTQNVRYTNAVGDMLLHVMMHGSHHRGQIAHAMRRHGDTPPMVDYIAFVRD
ncbi:MAG: DinB family protein [Candidatus Krumholzibacteria bacterium]|nr:DinB family protein [Candidatus Krumholzibacteria bacterium]MDH4336838.1 DinB family protein [Candidatus Krumholzibacteria bacterium]MDH5269169.1 DinB family protein [Candidatus Krumholzibacteria bacterium]MDH5628114.1 DinB family protein [Candidatus Krumholzibacteria bacterium]